MTVLGGLGFPARLAAAQTPAPAGGAGGPKGGNGFVQYVKSKSPEAVLVLLTHDHGDHIAGQS